MRHLKILTVLFLKLFILSIYVLPAANAVTLGEIKERDYTNSIEKKNVQLKRENPDDMNNRKKAPNPRLVCLLSVIMPGGGHFYLNNDSKGMGFCLSAGIGYTATGYFLVKTLMADVGSTEFKNYLLISGFLLFITLIVHFVGIIEAYDDADELNKKGIYGHNDPENPFNTKIILN